MLEDKHSSAPGFVFVEDKLSTLEKVCVYAFLCVCCSEIQLTELAAMLFQALPCSFMQMHVYVVQCKPLPTVAATPATQPLGLASLFPPSPQCRIIFLFFFS